MDALVKSATDKLEALEQAMYELASIRAIHTTPDGLVEATADGDGALVGLWLAESITQRTAKEVGDLVVEASQAAVAEAGRQRSAVMAKLNQCFTGGA
jgi:DNA-binding protein YbaB